MSSAARVRRCRERARNGRVVYRIEADELEVEALLVEARLLPPGGVDDRAAVEAALGRLIELLLIDRRNALQREI